MEPPSQLEHHQKQDYCTTRAAYREGRKLKAVKVYTINQESRYLIVQGVPAVGATQELLQLFALYGRITEYRILDEYPTSDQFTDVYWIKYERIQNARVAKRKLDDRSFFGGVLHVCYAPECESVDETREKLVERKKVIAAKCREYGYDNPKVAAPSAIDKSFQKLDTMQVPSLRTSVLPINMSLTDTAQCSGGGLSSVIQGSNQDIDTCITSAPSSNVHYPSTEPYPHDWPSTPSQTVHMPLAASNRQDHSLSKNGNYATDAAAWQKRTFAVPPTNGATDAGTPQKCTFAVPNADGSAQQKTVGNLDVPRKQPTAVKMDTAKVIIQTRGGAMSSKSLAASAPVIQYVHKMCGTPKQPAVTTFFDKTPVIREYHICTAQQPKFVPRQAVNKGAVSRITAAPCPSKTSSPASISELKFNAAVLGKVQGPPLPAQATQMSDTQTMTGSSSLDKTVFDIRSRIRKALSATLEAGATKAKKSQHGDEAMV